jgi:hypothetical protein
LGLNWLLRGRRRPSDADVAERWRALAVEARGAAEKLTDPEAKRIMVSIAEGYDILARRAETRKKDPKIQSDTTHRAMTLVP